MASPFKVFRKNAKVLLVGLFLLSMLSFVVIPSFLQWFETRQRRTAGIVVTTTKFGNLSDEQLRILHLKRANVRRFLQALRQKVMQMGGNSFRIAVVLQTIPEPTEENLVQAWLITQYARATGLRITDQTVNAFLRNLIDASGVALSQNDLLGVLQETRIDENTLFAGLEQELLIQRYLQLAGLDFLSLQPGLAGETPGIRWDYFLRLNRMASVELCAFPVERYLDQVPNPDERTIRAYFEEHKTRLPDPRSPEPGFKVPAKVTLEYLKGDLQKWLVNTKLTDDELRKVYEERKELFLRPSPPSQEGSTGQPAPSSGGQEKAPTQPPVSGSPADGSQPAQTPTGTSPEPSQTPAPGTPPQPRQPSESSPQQPEVPPSPPGNGDAAPQVPPAPSQSAPEGSSSSRRFFGEVRLAGMIEEATPTGEAQSPPESAKAQPQPPAPADTQSKEKPAEAPKTEQAAPSPAEPVSQAGSVAPSGGKEGEKAQGQPAPQASQPAQSTAPPADTAESKYQPFEAVKDQLRSIVIQERIKTALDEIEEIMRQYQGDLANYEAEKEEAEKAKRSPPTPPERPDLRKLAQDRGLDYVLVEDAAAWDLAERDIGQGLDAQGVPFARSVFEVAEFLSLRVMDLEGNQYLAWVTARVKEHVPTLDEPGIRDLVIRTWRMEQARKLAEKDGQALAEKANADGRPLGEFLKTVRPLGDGAPIPECVETEPFTWLTYGELGLGRSTRGLPSLSPIKTRVKDSASGLIVEKDAVEEPGDEFMATVFSLEPGQVGVAWNRRHTVMYLVRVIEFQPPMEQLFERFIRDAGQDALQVAQFDLATVVRHWTRDLEKEAGLKWVSAPGSRVPLD